MSKLPELQEAARREWRQLKGDIKEHYNLLWLHPELSMMEFQSSRLLQDWLRRSGFTVTAETCGLPTAFTATFGTDEGPAIGVLAEYDALPGLGNEALPTRKTDGSIAGHGCAHNEIAPTNIGAAIAASRVMQKHNLPGRIVVVGCPAEEIIWGKIALLKGGVFDGLDAILTSHADYQCGALSRPCLSGFHAEFVFMGISGHGARPGSANALEALELAVQTIERLRGHRFADCSVEHVIRRGGSMPGIVVDEARLWVTVRNVNYERAGEVFELISDLAKHSAELAGTQCARQIISSTRGYLANDTLADVIFRNMQLAGPPQWGNDDIQWMTSLAKQCSNGSVFELDRGVAIYRESYDMYCQDDGEISWRVPLGRANWAMPMQVPLHHWGTTALAGHAAGYPGPLMVSEALALSVVELLADHPLTKTADAELARRVSDYTLTEPLLGGHEALIGHPQSFWNAEW